MAKFQEASLQEEADKIKDNKPDETQTSANKPNDQEDNGSESKESSGKNEEVTLATSMDTLPEYVYPVNQERRYALMKELDFTPEMRNIFEKLCHYAVLPEINSSIVYVNDFLIFLSGKKDVKAFQRHAFLEPLYRLIKWVVKEGTGIIEVLEKDSIGNPDKILLREKESELLQLYRYISDYFEKSYTDFLAKTATLLTKKEALSALSISEPHFESLLHAVDTHTLTLENLHIIAQSNKPLVIFSGNQYIEDVVIPTSKIPKLVETFVRFVSSYYQDDINEEIRHHMFKKIKEQKLNTVRLSRVIREGLIGDSYFLFFSQLFYNIMLSIMDKISQQNFQNKEIYNQCFILYFLSSMSVNERNQMTDKKRSEAAVDEHYKAIISGSIMAAKQRRGRRIYMPLNVKELLQLEVEDTREESGRKVVKLETFYDEEAVRQLIRKKNFTGHDIENILIFSSSGVKYYLHRVRLIETFLCALENEREMVEVAIHEDWRQDPSKIIAKDKESEFIDLLERQYISAFFKNYLNLTTKVIFTSRAGSGGIDYVYLIKRLFLTEDDKLLLNLNVKDLLYRSSDIEKKKRVLERFCELLIDTRTRTPLQAYEILDLSFPVIRRSAIRNSEMGAIRKAFFALKEFFSTIVLFFEGNKSYLRFLTRRYYKLPSRFIDKRLNKSPLKRDSSSPLKQGSEPSAGKLRTSPEQISAHKKMAPAPIKGTRDRKADVATLLKNVPELRDPKKINERLEADHDLWNIKMGRVRKEVREMTDAKIESLVDRFDARAFSEKNMDLLYTKTVANSGIEPVGDKNALKRYIFYKAALMRYKKIK